mgnify:CR=1 FL=1
MKALISGITGQDGSYLAEFLISKGYKVYGIERRVAGTIKQEKRRERLKGLDITIIPADITNYSSVVNAFLQSKPDEIYHLAAQSNVGLSFKDPFTTIRTNIEGTLNMLEAFRLFSPNSRFYFAGSSEMFGKVNEEPQNEKTRFYPRSPYGVSKVAGFHLCRNYREAYNLFICNGILFNHESPRRGEDFVTKKIVSGLKEIKEGKKDKIKLGNLHSMRDWGYAKEYVEAMWLMLQQDKPDDYVIATGETHTIEEFLEEACKFYGLDPDKVVEIDPSLYRPSEVHLLRGDYSKAKEKLGWEPKTKFSDLVKLMCENE